MDAAIRTYAEVLGLSLLSGPFDDPIQRVRVCFLGTGNEQDMPVELISPLGDDAPIHQYLKKELGAYHVCYELVHFDAALAHMRSLRCLLVSGPSPAVAFGGRRIAWLFLPTRQLIEVVERE
ncbi:MAG: VOC family protein [Phycisphaerae bacterium]|jgi:methylmalonyl-CoA/ethylmalonyl-CoA epimerase|nr:VOC family protein [Phycisphaerae bacterium]